MSDTSTQPQSFAANTSARPAFVLLALGVVFGDIGTSPLYALRECFAHLPASPENVLGSLSLIFWSLTLVISIKYILVVTQADNRGEGGVLALMTLAQPQPRLVTRGRALVLVYLGVFGSALLYGDSAITPAISVLSAIEGLSVATPLLEPYILPTTIVILVGLFLLQPRGTAEIGGLFGPVIFTWFVVLALLGLAAILHQPGVLAAVNPAYGLSFLQNNGYQGFIAIGAIFLCVTGGEALYADMGHFGPKPIRRGWFLVACPALLLNYFGQGALLLNSPNEVSNLFFRLAPPWFRIPLVLLATAATIIASQAVISGAFSLTSQAVKLGLLPRLNIRHTSSRQIGQIYIPQVNWLLLVMTVWLVLEFRSSGALAAAYGVAVSTTMVITTVLIFFVAHKVLRWSLWASCLITALFLLIDLVFLCANLLKISSGGWFPLALGVLISILMMTWHKGRRIVRDKVRTKLPALRAFVHDVPELTPVRVPGTAVYMNIYKEVTPPALQYNLRHNKVIHDKVIVVNVLVEDGPYVSPVRRVELEALGREFYEVTLHYGFMDPIDVPRALSLCKDLAPHFDLANAIYFLGRETFSSSSPPFLKPWQLHLFAFLQRNLQEAGLFYGIRPDQIVEIGYRLEI